ncbi:unnamed protein product [Tilletia laevis]|uniref:Phytase-like domain-containing protein n=2 Tax=Tilletia TaxID=13289 RepID=A0A177UU71_9BASI|nr:hypothetical protein CF336_g4349 [Tilletia laevis]KAE8260384.1 hypothetical protein A4X03_0g3834 [Tilletia caries]KAE8202174.1 hypothetical protein CF335_g3520 [Tilletia laevis]CAD6884035.1 unnamed protein product [Tilletia caries]CAD6907353.1 unnamed protein product [Tilletia laevis]
MASNALLPIAGVALLGLAILYQTNLSASLHAFAGVTRSLDPNMTVLASSQCQSFPDIGACEDGWLHEDSGLLYLACSSLDGRRNWTPTMDKLNAARRPTTDAIYVVDTRASGSFASRLTKIQPTNYDGTNGDGTLNLHSLAVLEVPSKPKPTEGDDIAFDTGYTPPTLYLYLNNHRPPVDPLTSKPLDAHKFGANSTVEIFKTTLGDKTMEHVRTFADEVIATPNRVAPVSTDSFLVTNDHGSRKTGLLRSLSYVTNDGSIGFCDPTGCKIVADKLGYPNGIIAGAEPNQYWVPTMRDGKLKLFEWQPKDQSLVLIDDIYLDGPPGYPADNLSLNKRTGAILTASFSQAFKAILTHFPNFDNLTPSTVHRVSLNEGKEKFFGAKWKTEKVLEFDGVQFGGYTTAIEDADRKKMWLMGVGCPFVTVCSIS